MKKVIAFILAVFCVLSLSACAPKTPTEGLSAIRIGDTEKQVIEKVGEPDFRIGIARDVWGYDLDGEKSGEKLLWIREGRVVIMWAHDGSESLGWEVDKTYSFQSVDEAEKFSIWEPELEPTDIIGLFGTNFTAWETRTASETITYARKDGACVKFDFSLRALNTVALCDEDGIQTELWAYRGQNQK